MNKLNDSLGQLPAILSSHAGYSRVFQPGKLTFGFIMPLESYPLMPWPTLDNHLELAQLADNAGFSSLWLRF